MVWRILRLIVLSVTLLYMTQIHKPVLQYTVVKCSCTEVYFTFEIQSTCNLLWVTAIFFWLQISFQLLVWDDWYSRVWPQSEQTCTGAMTPPCTAAPTRTPGQPPPNKNGCPSCCPCWPLPDLSGSMTRWPSMARLVGDTGGLRGAGWIPDQEVGCCPCQADWTRGGREDQTCVPKPVYARAWPRVMQQCSWTELHGRGQKEEQVLSVMIPLTMVYPKS